MMRTQRSHVTPLGGRSIFTATLATLLLAGVPGLAQTAQAPQTPETPAAEAQPKPAAETSASSPTGAPLRIGVLMDLSGALGEFGESAARGAELAVRQLNAAGGVLGQPVEIVRGDGATDPDVSVREALRLIDEGKVSAIVGPMGSAAVLAVAERVARPRRVTVITPSATSPLISRLADDDFVFRATLSDAAQGPVLARVAHDQGIDRVAIFYRADPYGEGLRAAFEASFDGKVTARVALTEEKDSYLAELRQAAAASKSDGAAPALAAISFPREAAIYVKEALEAGLFSRFLFVDATRSAEIREAAGPRLDGMRGTAPAVGRGAEDPVVTAWSKEFTEAFGPLGGGAIGAAYDAAVCVALAAEKARSTDPVAVRDQLRAVCGRGGQPATAGAAGVAEALARVRRGKPVGYQGVTGRLDWTASGDVGSGFVSIWEYQEGAIVEIERVVYTAP